MRSLPSIGLLGLILMSAAQGSAAQTLTQEIQELLASDSMSGDEFGRSVSLDGDTALVGAYQGDDGDTRDAGSVYVFTRTDGTWNEQARLTASDAAAGERFGISVALDGDTALIGADRDDNAGPFTGRAYVFTRTGGSWYEQAQLTASDAAERDHFGGSVALDGDTALIGAYGNGDAGAAYVFTRTDGSWSERTKLRAADLASGDSFGISVSIDGDDALIGATGDDDGGSRDNGAAYVFTRTDGSWSEQAKLRASDAETFDSFGFSVSIDGDDALIGAWQSDIDGGFGSGSAYVFTRTGGNWSERAKLTASDATGNANFGVSVSLEGDVALIGAFGDDFDAGGSSPGAAYVFARSGQAWNERAKLTSRGSGLFGFSVSLDGDTALIGASRTETDGREEAGSAHVFDVSFEPGTVRVRVLGVVERGADDVEQRALGRVSFDSSDLELVTDRGFAQSVGLRFAGMAIPQGVDVVDAYLEFTVDEPTDVTTVLSIDGVASDDAARWSAARDGVSSLARTSASVGWSPAPWARRNTVTSATRSPDLGDVIEEIVARPGWRSGNALAFVIEGMGERVAHSREAGAALAPRLIVEYLSRDGNSAPTVDAGEDLTALISGAANLSGRIVDDGLPVPPGATSARWNVVSGPGTVTFEDADSAVTTAIFSHAGRYVLRLRGFDGELGGQDRVEVSVMNEEGGMVIDRRVAASADDAEEEVPFPGASGPVDVDSSDLELALESTPQLVGMRFTDLPIPLGATITRAYLQFTVDDTRNSGGIALSVSGQSADDAPPFASEAGDLTSRPRTGTTVGWSPPRWERVGDSGAAQRTSDLSAVIQAIIERGGWCSGNAMVLLIEGSGQRIAESFDGRPGSAPLLLIEYE